jgi:hypothetical protein
MPTFNLSIELNDVQATGVAQARTAYNATLPQGATSFDDVTYMEWVMTRATDSWVNQYAGSAPVSPSPIAPTIDWAGLIAELEPYFNIGLAANYVVFTQCLNMLVALKRTASFDNISIEWRNFAYNLNLGKDAFTPTQKTEIEAIFDAKDTPFIFDT